MFSTVHKTYALTWISFETLNIVCFDHTRFHVHVTMTRIHVTVNIILAVTLLVCCAVRMIESRTFQEVKNLKDNLLNNETFDETIRPVLNQSDAVGRYIIMIIYLTSKVKSRYLEVDGTIFYKFKLPEVQINLHFG